MDGAATPQSVDQPPAVDAGADAAAWKKEFGELVGSVRTTAREWGVRPDSLEGRFVSALLGTTEWLGRLSASSQATFEALGRQNRDVAERELERARQITKAAEVALGQARTAQISLQCEQENLVYRMMKEVMPLFVTKLCETLAQREKTWNGGLRPRRYVVTGLLTLGLFLGGYAVCAWQVRGATSFLGQCMAHQVSANGRTYCEMTGFAQVAQ